MDTKPRLVVVTTNYPFTFNGGETMFVAPEMARLAQEFEALTVAPLHTGGDRLDVPRGVDVDVRLAGMLRRGRIGAHVAALFGRGFWPEMRRGWRHGGWVGVARVWRWAAIAQVTARWARATYAASSPLLFYTYWRGGSTLALARLTSQRPMTGVVTRVHRYELYEDAFEPPFQPWHPALYSALCLTATISQDGLDYLLAAGVEAARLDLYRLGTEPLPERASASVDGVVRVVSCSQVTAVKRVPRIAEALVALARRHVAQRFEWTHFGAGAEFDRVRAIAAQAPRNLTIHLRGQVANEEVRQHYTSASVDGFVLLSESEGLPVSIQEAASAGVPVIATDVGGVRELVGDDNGILLALASGTEVVVDALERVLLDPDVGQRQARRDASFRRWQGSFDAQTNHTRFAQRLRVLLDALALKRSSTQSVTDPP